MRILTTTALVVFLAGAAVPAAAQSRVATERGAAVLPTAADAYAREAALSDRFEIESSRLAVSRARSDELRALARLMIDEHTASTNGLVDALTAADMPIPNTSSPGKGRQGIMDALQQPSAGSKEFDDRYLGAQIQDHKVALALHENYAARGDNPALRDYAARTAPIVAAHLDMLNKMRP
jgi:putative membrane protein